MISRGQLPPSVAAEHINRATVFLATLDIPQTEREQRLAVVRALLSWHGTPYRHAMRGKGVGVDCAQLPIAAFAEAGVIDAFDVPEYPADWFQHREEERYIGVVEGYMRRVQRGAWPGDLALFTFGRCTSHSAPVICWPMVIHAWALQTQRVTLADAERDPCFRTQTGELRITGIWSLRKWEETRAAKPIALTADDDLVESDIAPGWWERLRSFVA